MDIEEDIKILENLKKYLNLLIYEGTHKIIYNDLGWDEKTIDCINAIDHILEEREEDKKKIDKLQVLEDDLKDKRIVYVDTPEFEENYIPKQKVKKIKDKFNKEYHKIYIKSNILSEKEKLNLEEKAKLQECTVLMQEIGCFIDNLQEILEDK